MNSGSISLDPHLNPSWDISNEHKVYWERFLNEANSALLRTDSKLLRHWAVETVGIAAEVTARRAGNLWGLLKAVAEGAWNEFKRICKALWRGKISDYFKDFCRRAWNVLRQLWGWIKDQTLEAKSFLLSLKSASKEELAEIAVALLGAVLGFMLVGGTGGGGVIDSDISTFGIGGHRSIWFHSIFVGLAGEVTFLSIFKLIGLLHANLPSDHLPAWDRMLIIANRFTKGLIGGTWVGVTTHLAVDSHIDGWTPYKDLPVALPNWAHHMVMDMNAAAAGWFSWQWYDKVKRHFRRNAFTPPRKKIAYIFKKNLPTIE